jgi:hypothetical protein
MTETTNNETTEPDHLSLLEFINSYAQKVSTLEAIEGEFLAGNYLDEDDIAYLIREARWAASLALNAYLSLIPADSE